MIDPLLTTDVEYVNGCWAAYADSIRKGDCPTSHQASCRILARNLSFALACVVTADAFLGCGYDSYELGEDSAWLAMQVLRRAGIWKERP